LEQEHADTFNFELQGISPLSAFQHAGTCPLFKEIKGDSPTCRFRMGIRGVLQLQLHLKQEYAAVAEYTDGNTAKRGDKQAAGITPTAAIFLISCHGIFFDHRGIIRRRRTCINRKIKFGKYLAIYIFN
jgi:hypothetical protein